MKRAVKRYFTCIIAIIEIIIITGIYYYFWRIGYTHGIEGYPEYLGVGKFILMGVYLVLAMIMLFFAGAFKFGRLRAGSIVVRQCAVIIIVNIITILQLSLTAKHLVAKRPMFDATIVQILFIVIYSVAVTFLVKRYNIAGKMLVIGESEIECIDGYRIEKVDMEQHTMIDLSSLFEKADRYDAVLIQHSDETSEYLIKHCLEQKKAVYVANKTPMVYGVSRMKQNDTNYILVLGMDDGEGRLIDRARAYLI